MPATYSKPLTIPRWADDGLNTVEPSSPKKDEGWVFEEVPPSSWENWRANLIGSWFKWIDERLDDGVDENELTVRDPGDASSAVRIGSGLVSFDKPLNAPSLLQLAAAGTTEFQVGVGYARTQGEHRFADPTFSASMILGKPTLVFDASDVIEYDRGVNRWSFKTATVERFAVGANGAEFGDPYFYLQFTGGSPRIVFASTPALWYLLFDRGTNRLEFWGASGRTFASAGATFTIAPDSANTSLTFGSSSSCQINCGLTQMSLRGGGIQNQLELTQTSLVFREGLTYNPIVMTFGSFGVTAPTLDVYFDGRIGRNSLANGTGDVYAKRIHGFWDQNDPQSSANAGCQTGRNGVLGCGVLYMQGAANPTLSTNHWNFDAAARTGVGVFNLTLLQAVDSQACIQVSIRQTGIDERMRVSAVFTSSTNIQINTYLNNAATDFALGTDLHVAIFGRTTGAL